MKDKVLPIVLFVLFLAILTGCKSPQYKRDFKFGDVYDVDELERETTELEDEFKDARQLEIRFNGVTLRQAVDELNQLDTDYTVYLAVTTTGSSPSFGEPGLIVVSPSDDSQDDVLGLSQVPKTDPLSSSSDLSPDKLSTDLSSSQIADDVLGTAPAPFAPKYGSLSRSPANKLPDVHQGFGSATRNPFTSTGVPPTIPPEERTISGLFTGSVRDIVCELSGLYGLDFAEFGTKLYIGGDLTNYVVNVVCETSLDDESIKKIAKMANVQIIKTSNKLLITGRTRDVRRAYELLEQLAEIPRSYNVDLIFIDVFESQLADLRAKVEVQSVNLIQKGLSAWDVFKATGAIDLQNTQAYNYTDQELYCTDGKKVQLRIGTEYKREQRAITDQGTSTVLGYETERDGIIMALTPIRSIGSTVNMEIKYENGSFLGADYSKFNTTLDYDSVTFTQNKIYYLTCVDDQARSRKGVFVGITKEQQHRVTTIWLCVRPVVAKVNKNNSI